MPNTSNQTTGTGLVSVVIPMHNARNTILSSIRSVMVQDYPHIEILIIDDGSTDGSLELVEGLGLNVRLFKGQNHGPAAARNYGARKATGQWIAFLDSDDVWHDSKLRLQLQLMGEHKWGYCDSQFLGGTNDLRLRSDFSKMHDGAILKHLALDNFIATSTVIIDRAVFLKSGGFDETLDSIEDWDLWLRIAKHRTISYLNQSLVSYRVHNNSLSRDLSRTISTHHRVIKKSFSPDGPLYQYPGLYRKAMANSMVICARISEEEGNMMLATKLALKAALYNRGNWLFATKTIVKTLFFGRTISLHRTYSLS